MLVEMSSLDVEVSIYFIHSYTRAQNRVRSLLFVLRYVFC